MPYIVNKRELVSPGELLAEGDYNAGKNTYQEHNKIYASRVGLVNFIGKNVYVVALKGNYIPVIGDLVIGKVVDMRLSGWMVDINSPYIAMLFSSDALGRSFNARRDDMTDFLDIGDLVLAKVNTFDRTRDPTLTIKESGLGKIKQGQIATITPTKIPRVIGRRGSMINTLTRETGCRITVAQNGIVWVYGPKFDLEVLAIQSVQMIEKDAHTIGLTDRISDFIKKEKEMVESSIE